MGIRVNVSTQESQAGDRDPLPAGRFNVAITDVELRESNSDAHPGEPMLYFEFTVQDGQYADRKDFTNACLWDGALYTIVGMMKALDMPVEEGELDVPTEPEAWLGQKLVTRRALDPKQKERWPDMPERWIQIRGFAPYKGADANGQVSPDAALLP